MHNLKSLKAHTIKAHLDRMQDTAENLAVWMAGEVLAGRGESAQSLGVLASRLLILKSSLSDLAEKTRGPEPADN